MSGYVYVAECQQEPGLRRTFKTPEEREKWMDEHAAATAHLDPVPWPTPHGFNSWAEKTDA